HLLGREQRVPGHLAQVGADQVGAVPVFFAGAVELVRGVHCLMENVRLWPGIPGAEPRDKGHTTRKRRLMSRRSKLLIALAAVLALLVAGDLVAKGLAERQLRDRARDAVPGA